MPLDAKQVQVNSPFNLNSQKTINQAAGSAGTDGANTSQVPSLGTDTIVPHTTGATLGATDVLPKAHTNAGASGEVALTLPPPTGVGSVPVGSKFKMMVTDPQYFRLVAQGGTQIYLEDQEACAVNGFVRSNQPQPGPSPVAGAVGSQLEVELVQNGSSAYLWFAKVTGSWKADT